MWIFEFGYCELYVGVGVFGLVEYEVVEIVVDFVVCYCVCFFLDVVEDYFFGDYV